jgi:hypothetical protein
MVLEPAKPIPKKSVLHQQIPTLGGLGLGEICKQKFINFIVKNDILNS